MDNDETTREASHKYVRQTVSCWPRRRRVKMRKAKCKVAAEECVLFVCKRPVGSLQEGKGQWLVELLKSTKAPGSDFKEAYTLSTSIAFIVDTALNFISGSF